MNPACQYVVQRPNVTIPVVVMHRDTSQRVLELFMPREGTWTTREASWLLDAIYEELRPTATLSFRVREVMMGRTYRLELVFDSGTACTPPLGFSAAAVEWWRDRQVRSLGVTAVQ